MRAYVYPMLDSVVATVSGAPAVSRVLGFDPDDGVLAFMDDEDHPRRLDLRASEVRVASRATLASLTTVNGSDLYGVTPKGTIRRITPTGDWSFEPPAPARWVFPQPNGSVVIAGIVGDKTELWLIRPTDDEILGTATLPVTTRGVRTQVGDRIYFTVDSGLVGVRTRDLGLLKSVHLRAPVAAVVPTPSGDRLYVATKGSRTLSVIDRYTETITETVDLPGIASELRMDPLGQSVLARPASGGDSAWVIGVGTHRVRGTVKTEWRADLPSFSPGATIATVRGNDVAFLDEMTLAVRQTITGGAVDFWSFVTWNGFRPRAAGLDNPVTFEVPPEPMDSASGAVAPGTDSMGPPPIRDANPWMIEPPPVLPPRARSYMVSFAAVLSEQKATESANEIAVNGVRPRVVPTQSGATTIYRVVLGPYPSREEADRVGKDSRRSYWIYEEGQ
ncbi:MAG: SPOR domain-containing protein [Gemmatimonadaceae bacterium]